MPGLQARFYFGDVMFYDINHVLTYNAYFNFLIGERGVGKTYSAKKFVINKFLKSGAQFIYLRRYKTESSKAKKTFFNDVSSEFKGHSFENRGDLFYIDDKVAGFSISLSVANILKSVCYDQVQTIIFDEFIIDKGCYHYLSSEVNTFLEFCETVFRLRDNVRVLFLANAISQTNPYFLYFNITHNKFKNIQLYNDGLILVHIMNNQDYRNFKKSTKFGRLVANSDYGNYAIDNAFLRDNDNFIAKKSGNCSFSFAFIFQDQTFGVWYNYKGGRVFVSSDYEYNTPYIFTTTLENHRPNSLLLKNAKKYNCWNDFLKQFKYGNVYFENMKIKNITLELIKLILT